MKLNYAKNYFPVPSIEGTGKTKVNTRNVKDVALFLAELYERTNPCFPTVRILKAIFILP